MPLYLVYCKRQGTMFNLQIKLWLFNYVENTALFPWKSETVALHRGYLKRSKMTSDF